MQVSATATDNQSITPEEQYIHLPKCVMINYLSHGIKLNIGKLKSNSNFLSVLRINDGFFKNLDFSTG